MGKKDKQNNSDKPRDSKRKGGKEKLDRET